FGKPGAREAVVLARKRRDEKLVGRSARKRAKTDQALALEHHSFPVRPLEGQELAEPTASAGRYGRESRGPLRERDELGMGVWAAGTGGAALVDECEHGCETGSASRLRPQPPRGRNGPELGFGEIGERKD